MINKFIVFFIYFLLSFSTVNAVNLPVWYEKGKKNNKLYIYGIGSGSTVDGAIDSALYNIKNDFIVKNRDNEKNTYDIVKNNVNINYSDKNNLNIDLLNFSNYKVEKEEKINGYYYVLVNIKRNELFNLQKQQLDDIVLNLNKLYLSLSKKSDFAKVNEISNIFRLIDEVKNKIKIIKLIGNFNGTKYLELCRKIEKEYKNILDNLDIRIIFEKQELVPLLEVISNNIAMNNRIKINDRSKNVLLLSYITKQVIVENHYGIDVLFYLKITDKSNNLVYYDSFNYNFTSGESFDDAIVNIINYFSDDLEKNKISISFINYEDEN